MIVSREADNNSRSNSGSAYVWSGALTGSAPADDPNGMVAAGRSSSCAIKSNNTLWCWGSNSDGQLGVGSTSSYALSPMQVPGLWVSVSASAAGRTVCGVKVDTSVWCWGRATDGQLGNNQTMVNALSPVAVMGVGSPSTTLTGAVSVSVGQKHACALRSNATAVCWGDGTNGKLGNGLTTQQLLPVQVASLTNIRQLSAGGEHTCFVLASGGGRCLGSDALGQLGDGGGMGGQSLTPVTVTGVTNFRQITAGTAHTCAITTAGRAYCWGTTANGRLGNGVTSPDQASPVLITSPTNFRQISAGTSHTCATLTDGTARCWGNGTNGRLGNGATSQQTTPVTPTGLTGASAITSGDSHTCAVLRDRSIRCWGNRAEARLGDSFTTPDRTTATRPDGM